MSMWNTEQIRLNELEWLVRSTVSVQVEYGRNPTHRMREWLVKGVRAKIFPWINFFKIFNAVR